MLQRIRMIMWKEFVQISRDARMLGVVIVLPVLMLVLYGYAINFDVKHLPLAIYDQDRSQASRELISAFAQSDYFDVVASLQSYPEVTQALDRGQATVVLVIPTTYDADLAAGRTTAVQVLVDGSDSTTASTAIGYAQAMVQQHSAQIAVQALQGTGLNTSGASLPVDNRVRYWYNPELKSTNFIIPGLIAVILMMLAALLTSMTVVRERERGTIESLIVSPVMPVELMLGKLIPYVVIAFFDVVLVMVASVLLFRIPLVGSPVLVLVLSGIFLTAALGIGLLISTVATSQQFAMTVAVMATQLPSVLMSGFLFPINSMPPKVQLLTNLIPATHFIKILRAVFLKGSSLADLWQPTLFLLLIGGLMLGLSALRFQKKI
ncbi:MAG: Inner membrane transport permease YbhS [bacterium ADurb.Bin429]|nr:MAG: Inner membrane transport permease YbhS [bacterium ADurb.Bin429]